MTGIKCFNLLNLKIDDNNFFLEDEKIIEKNNRKSTLLMMSIIFITIASKEIFFAGHDLKSLFPIIALTLSIVLGITVVMMYLHKRSDHTGKISILNRKRKEFYKNNFVAIKKNLASLKANEQLFVEKWVMKSLDKKELEIYRETISAQEERL